MQTQNMFRAVTVVAGLVLLGAGCNPFASIGERMGENAAENIIERATGGDADVNLGGAMLQANFPSDVPRYPNANYQASIVQREGTYAIANFTTSDETSVIADWFDAELKKNGFTLDTDLSFGGLARAYQKNDVTIVLQIQGPDESDHLTTVSIQRTEDTGSGN